MISTSLTIVFYVLVSVLLVCVLFEMVRNRLVFLIILLFSLNSLIALLGLLSHDSFFRSLMLCCLITVCCSMIIFRTFFLRSKEKRKILSKESRYYQRFLYFSSIVSALISLILWISILHGL